MLAICRSCGMRTTRAFPAYPGRCNRCGTDTMEKQVFPWQVECLDCGHIKTADTAPEHFRACRCVCHQRDNHVANGGGVGGRGINQSSGPHAPQSRPDTRRGKDRRASGR